MTSRRSEQPAGLVEDVAVVADGRLVEDGDAGV